MARKPQAKTLDSHPNIFRSILSQIEIEAAQGLKSPFLKSLYNLLSYCSSFQQECVAKGADVNGFVMKIGNSEVWVAYKEICRLSDILFKDFSQRFEQLFTIWHDVSESMAPGQAGSQQTDMWVATDELNLLVRCCMIILNLPVSQENLLGNGKALLLILKKLSVLKLGGKENNVMDFEMLLSSECLDSGKDRFGFSDGNNAALSTLHCPLYQSVPFLSAILEVFVDELLLHGQLRRKLLLLDSFSPSSGRLFMHLSYHTDIGIVMELISAHFLLSVPDELKFKDFLNKLSWVQGKKFKTPELSLITARSLVLDPILRSAPKLMRAHLLSMLSDSIGIGPVPENSKPDPRLIHCYLSTFESSVILYSQDISWLRKKLHPIAAKASLHKSSSCSKTFQLSFETLLEETKKMEIDHVISKLNDFWHSQLKSMFSGTKLDLVTLCEAHIQDNRYILDTTNTDEVFSISGYLLVKAADDVVHPKGSTSLEDICLLASLLKLMSSSLFQVLWCLRYSGDPLCLKSFKDFSFLSIISCLEDFRIQTSFSVMMETCQSEHKELMLMLLHFLGLLSLTFQTGVDFLVKGCISIIMALMNLIVFEEGNLGSLRSLADLGSELSLSVKSPFNSQADLMDQNSSVTPASKFQDIQNLNLSKVSVVNDSAEGKDIQSENPSNTSVPENMDQVPAMEKEMCNGEIFLEAILGDTEILPDFDDLSDFIVCKEGKNYSGWLKNRERFRKMKYERGVKLRWKKRQKTYRSLVGENTRRASLRKKP